MTPSPTMMLQIAGLFVLMASLAASAHALLTKRDPRSALGWVALVVFSPVIGMGVYLLFGVNRIRRRAKRIREERKPGEVKSPLIPGAIDSLQRPFLQDNQVECLLTGQTTLAAVSQMVRAAQRSIYLSVYIFEANGVGDWLIKELGAAVGRGVKVRVLLDGVGLFYSRGHTRRKLIAAGVDVGVYLRPTLFPPAWHINMRNHRKILIADESEAIVGGTNVRNVYVVQDGDKEPKAKDVNFTLRGPVVADIVTVFADDWLTATDEAIQVKPLPAAAAIDRSTPNSSCRVTVDGPDNDVDLISLLYMAAISESQRTVRIVTPYFLPPQELIAAMQVAAIRGVRVEIVLPAKNNLPFMHWATQNMLPQLLRYGVLIYYQQGPFDHSKLFVVDDSYALVGSANVDARSLILNFEISVEIKSTDVAGVLNQHVDRCLEQSRRVTAEELEQRSLPVRLRDALFWLFTPYL